MTDELILAIDSTTEQAGIAILSAGELLGECCWLARGQHSRQLERALRELLTLTDTNLPSISAIAVASGPGSFNGLRVGISFAKGLAMAVHAPLVGISTLDVIGSQSCGQGEAIWALIPAGRDEVYLGRYAGSAESWRRQGQYDRVQIEKVADEYAPDILLAGEGASAVATAARSLGKPVRTTSGPDALRRTGFLAELGRRYFAARGADQIDELQPVYLRRSSAEENRVGTKRE